MHIELGKLKGRKLLIQKAGLRPTTSLVKTALLNIIRHDLVGKKLVDCFAGTGAIGFESLSLGAKEVGFVELNKKAVEFLYKNASNLGVSDQATIKHQNVLDFLKSSREEWDFLFFSPPYDTIHWYQLLRSIEASPIIKENTTIIIQHPKQIVLEPLVLKKVRESHYGFNILSFFKKESL